MNYDKASNWALGIATGILLVACGTTGEVGGGVKNGPFGINFYGGAKWGATGPKDWCGCVFWLDASGNRMGVPAGQLRHGHGAGIVPKGAKGFEVELEKCEDWEGCDAGEGTPQAASVEGSPGVSMQFIGAGITDHGTVDYRMLVSADSRGACRAKRDLVLDRLDGAPLPGGVEIVNLTVTAPVWNGAIFVGMAARALDDEPISAHVLRVNGQVESVSLGSVSAGNGWWEVPHSIGTANLSLGRSTRNRFEVSWTTAAGGTQIVEREILYDAF